MANRLVFIVEGDCEEYLVNQKIIPYLYLQVPAGVSWTMNVQKITTNRKLHARGGNVSYAYLEADIRRTSKQNGGNTYITTFLDYFRLPNDFPGYQTQNIDLIEEAMSHDLPEIKLIPYIQKYEFETLLFSSKDALSFVIDSPSGMNDIERILDQFPNVEDINGGSETAPSKRLAHIFPYNKVIDSMLVLDMVEMSVILDKCPRFSGWIAKLVHLVSNE